jgi:integrase
MFRVVTVAADGTRGRRSFATEREATEYRDAFIQATENRTLGIAVEEYLAHLRVKGCDGQGVRESTLKTNRYRLTAILRLKEGDRALAILTPSYVRRLYVRRTEESRADTHRAELALLSAACDWWVRQGWLRANPAAEVEPTGAKHARKEQPRITEARLFLAAALGECSSEGLCAAMTLLMGLRASEVCNRIARDLDDGGRVLWITDGKTSNSDRRVRVPSLIREQLVERARGKAPAERLFPEMTRFALAYHVKRFCQKAGIGAFGPHAMRKAFATLAVEGGGSGGAVEMVARELGHGGSGVTLRHYAANGAAESAGVTRLEDMLAPGGNLGTVVENSFPAGEDSEASSGQAELN